MPIEPRARFEPPARRAFVALAFCLASPLGAQDVARPVDPAHGRIVFVVAEDVADAAGRTRIIVQASTERTYSCLVPLAARMVAAGDSVVLDRWNIPPSPLCSEEIGPASGAIRLPWDVGRHTLVIRHLGAEDRYRVDISSDAIRVMPSAAPRRASILTDTLVWRFPRNSFAVRCGTTELNAWVCAELFRMLARTPGIESVDIPLIGRDPFGNRFGDYGHWHNESTRYYRRSSPRDATGLERDVQAFYDAYVGRRLGYSISIFDWTGRVWFTTAARDGDIR
jgi:hypothetical protein